ncbi:hypothetical protein RCC89_00435 [Cytophagaceae bacterium ABcell3]|nr:hypothetical protein RCC89_00435 [Cytophagaceae bacterium ABcell3]
MKPVIAALLLLLSFTHKVSAQEEELYNIPPIWKLGDKKNVTIEANNQVIVNDSVISNTRSKQKYIIEVIDTSGHYKLLYNFNAGETELDFSSEISEIEEMPNMIIELVHNIENQIKDMSYIVNINKETGLAFGIDNEGDLIAHIKSASNNFLQDYAFKMKIPKAKADSLEYKVVSYLTKVKQGLLETTINEVNSILQAYSYSFPINDSIFIETEVYDVNALGGFTGSDFPAIMMIAAELVDEERPLLIKTQLNYDKAFFLEQIKGK